MMSDKGLSANPDWPS